MNDKVIPELWDHQKAAVIRAKELNKMFLFFDIGTGKTPCVITILRNIYTKHMTIVPTLVLGPVSILQQWKDEFNTFSKIDQTKIHAVTDTGKKRINNLKKILEFGSNQIIIMNYEALLNDEIFMLLREWGPKALICDESHLLKGERSKRSKKVFELSKNAHYKYGLTGTPILKNPLDLFMQFKIIDGGNIFGTNFFVFRNKYMIDKNASWSNKPGHFPNFVPNPVMYPELTAKVASIACQAKKEDCIDLPEMIKIKKYCTMSPDQKKAYTEMERDFLTYLKEDHQDKPRAAVAQIAASKANKLLQIASGFVYDEDKKPFYFKGNPKIDLLTDLLEQVDGKKVIIWAHFKPNHVQIIEMLEKKGIKYVQLDGDASTKEKAERQQIFREDKEVLVCLANQGAAGTGVNLREAGYSFYFSKDFSYGKDEQSEGRNFRGGSILFHDSVTRIDLLTEGTIEERTMQLIKEKKSISDVIMDWRDL